MKITFTNSIDFFYHIKKMAESNGMLILRRNYIRTAGVSGSFNIKQINSVMNNLLTLRSGLRMILILSFLAVNLLSVHAQDTLAVHGVVLSGSNTPVRNVSVSIEGSFDLPVLTNNKGEFEVKTTSLDDWLIVAPSSQYKSKRVYLNNRTELAIYLTEKDMISGDDNLLILGQRRLRRDVVSSVSDLDISTVNHSTALSIDQHMQGRIPGLHVLNRSGDPGSGAVSLLRGVTSLNANNQPLYIVDDIILTPQNLFGSNLDGYSYNPLLGISPFDISRTTVIKDPAITSVYGSKASNGLVVIETLDPSATATSIEVYLRSGYSLAPSNQIPLLNADQHKSLISEILFSSGMFNEDVKERYPNLYVKPKDERWIDYQHDTNWQDLIFQNSFFNSLNLKVKGGDEIARYGLSLGYTNNKGIIKTTGYQGVNLRFVSLLNIFEWLKMNAGVSLNYNLSDLKESARIKETSPILTSLSKSPMLNPYQYDLEGNMLFILAEVDELGVSNPQAVIDNYQAQNSNYHFVGNLGLEVTLSEKIFFKTTFGLTYNVLKEQLFLPNKGMERYYNLEAHNVSKASNNDLNSFNNISYLTYNNTFGKNHKLFSTTGLNILHNDFQYDWGLTKNAHENDEYRMLQDGTNNLREIGGQNRLWNWVSLYENLTYSFKDRYLVTASLSIDGSSRVGENAAKTLKIGKYPFGVFYSGGLAWRISGEPFMDKLDWIEEFKLRATYGKTGNDDIGETTATNYYTSVRYNETMGLYPGTLVNDELTYETVNQLDLGIDLAVLGNRFRASFDLFNSITDNLLVFVPVDSYLGFNFRPENAGKLQNKGWELSTFLRLIDGRNFKWDIQASVSTSSNEIQEIVGDKYIIDLDGAQLVNMVGEAANSFYGYIFEGVFTTQEEADQAALINDRDFAYKAGDARFKDISGPNGKPDHVINEYDKTIIGSATPEQYGGLANTFTFKRWTLSAFLQFVTGNEVFNYVRYKNEQMSNLFNQSTRTLNRWQYDGQVTDVPRAYWNDPIGNADFSTRWIEDGSFMRIKNVTVSYKLPDEFLAFQNAEIFVSASNLYTLTKYLGYDPEFGYSHSQVGQGIDYGLTPQCRQFVVGVKLGL